MILCQQALAFLNEEHHMGKHRRIARRRQVHFAIALAAPALAGRFSGVARESFDQPALDGEAQPRSAIFSRPLEDRSAVCRSASNDPGTR
jgi:hypothetical protein